MTYKFLIIILGVILIIVLYFTISISINDENNIILKEYKDNMVNCKK